MSKPPLAAVQQWQLRWPPTLYDGTEPSEPRSVVLAKLGSFPAPLWVGSTHLPPSDAQARTDALRRLATLAQKLDGHWVICGDFNTPASSWLDDWPSVVVCPEPAQPTYPATEPVKAILVMGSRLHQVHLTSEWKVRTILSNLVQRGRTFLQYCLASRRDVCELDLSCCVQAAKQPVRASNRDARRRRD